MSYSVTLVDCPDTPSAAIRAAEGRFRCALESSLVEGVEPFLKAFKRANNPRLIGVTDAELRLAEAWLRAYELADAAGFLGLCADDEAYFEVRLLDDIVVNPHWTDQA